MWKVTTLLFAVFIACSGFGDLLSENGDPDMSVFEAMESEDDSSECPACGPEPDCPPICEAPNALACLGVS